MNTELRTNLVELLRETGHAHHAAFAATDGADPDWSIWYAEYLQSAPSGTAAKGAMLSAPQPLSCWPG